MCKNYERNHYWLGLSELSYSSCSTLRACLNLLGRGWLSCLRNMIFCIWLCFVMLSSLSLSMSFFELEAEELTIMGLPNKSFSLRVSIEELKIACTVWEGRLLANGYGISIYFSSSLMGGVIDPKGLVCNWCFSSSTCAEFRNLSNG